MSIAEIQVGLREEPDTTGEELKRQLIQWGIDGIKQVKSAAVYRFEDITPQQAEMLAKQALTDPITQRFAVNAPLIEDGSSSLEIGYKPGVMNPVEASLMNVARSLGVEPAAVSASTVYFVEGEVEQEQLAGIGQKLASQVEEIIDRRPETLIITGQSGPVETIKVRELDDRSLAELSERRRLFLDRAEMQVIAQHFRALGREPTDVELETIAQTWSEHNGHKTFKAKLIDQSGREKPPLITRIRETSAKYFGRVGVVTAFKDNAGGIRFYEGQAIIAKGETHNSPVAVEPYGGSLTKNGGVYRDIAGCGLGGVNLAAVMINCLGLPDIRVEDVPAGTLHPRHLMLENSRGERDYGNRMGIPTHAISLHFHPDFGPKPTSMGVVVGIIPEAASQPGQPQSGDLLITVGGKTGRDGIHGATFSSGEMTAATSSVDATAVQIGNAIEQKRMFDALVAARDAGLIRAITDCGGGGYSSAIGEIAADIGIAVHLDRVPQKYSGLAPWEIWLSESQERMIVAVSPDNWKRFKKICVGFDTPAERIGVFTGDNQLTLYHGTSDPVARLDMNWLHHGLPQREMKISRIIYPENLAVPQEPQDWIAVYKQVLEHLNVCSKEEMHRMYDQTVQGRTVLAPFTGVHEDVPSEASIVAPIYGRPCGVVMTQSLNPVLNRLDPHTGTVWTVAQAASKYTAAGGNINEAALIDNFVWPKPDPKHLGDLDRSVDALCEMMDVLQIPCVSGKDSLSSTFKAADGKQTHIPPVLNITVFGRIADVNQTSSCDIKSAGSALVVVGRPDVNSLGGSIYFQSQEIINTHLPQVDLTDLPRVLESVRKGIEKGEVTSCKAIGEGGIASAIALMCFGGDCGAQIDIGVLGAKRPDFAWFNETAGCLIVEVADKNSAERLFGLVPHQVIGKTTAEKEISVSNRGQKLFKAEVDELKTAWQKPIKEVLA